MTTTPITPAATGRREERGGAGYVVYTRTFRAPIDDVWAAVTEPARLERWIGTWTG
ncbi:MAG: polyketide cyclase, partial [Actinomycetota bacterium]|nr:polyketide cyclase [Actinomycetota bacterium]